MNSRTILILLSVLTGLIGTGRYALAEFEPTVSGEMNREIYIPFEDLSGLLEDQPERVLLSRAEYESLLDKARKQPEAHAPRSVMLAAAEYVIAIEQARAVLVGTISVEVLNDGMHTVDLGLNGVGLRAATLDGQGAPIGRGKDDALELFVEGVGSHELVLDMVTRVETTAAFQSLQFQVPTPPATRMSVVVPGNVELRKGATVINRSFDEDAQTTRFELLPQRAGVALVADEAAQVTRAEPAAVPGTVSLVMTLNSRLLQSRRVVVARAVIVDEITEAYERLHATFSMNVLHRPVDRFRFALPVGFEPTNVNSPLLSHWGVDTAGPEHVLDVCLREPATGMVRISFSGVSKEDVSRLANWTLPQVRPLDVACTASVVGVLLEDGLEITTLKPENLIPIDTTVLRGALPATLLERSAGEPRLRTVAAYYAPIGIDATELRGRFEKPAARLSVKTSILLTLDEKNLHARGGISLLPEVEKIFDVALSAPSEWHIHDVTDAAGNSLPFDVYEADSLEESRVRVHLPSSVPPGHVYGIFFQAVHTPADWLSDWTSTRVVFPVFAVVGALRDVGAIAVRAGEDMAVYPQTMDRLTPLDEDEKAAYGLAEMTASYQSPAYRYEAQPYHATFRVERTAPRLTARTYSFVRLESELLTAHYEIAYDIEKARTRKLSLRLPESTPPDLSIQALDGVVIKEYQGSMVDGMRRWTIELAEGHRDTVRLAVDFEQGLDTPDEKELELPIILADDVVYQSGFVSVEGGPEVDLNITSHPRKVDVGELSGATYRPERAVLGPRRGGGVFAFVGDGPEVTVLISRPPEYALPPAIVQHAELVTLVSDDGVSQSAARFHLRTKAAFLQIELPADSILWSAELDGMPAKPQREGGHLLLSVPAKTANDLRDLQIVYETPVENAAFWSDLNVYAPRLLLRADGGNSPGIDVPVANLDWHLYLPTGFDVVNHGGTVTGTPAAAPELAVWTMSKFLYRLAGGVNLFYYLPKLSRARELSTGSLSRIKGIATSSRIYEAESPTSRTQAMRRSRRARSSKKKAEETQPATQEGRVAGIAGADEKKGDQVAAGGRPGRWTLEGVRSLKIDLERSGQLIEFQSLGHDPRLDVTLINNRRVRSLTWGLALGIGVFGLALTNRSARSKALYVITTFSVATLAPLISGSPGMMYIANPLVYVACLLVPFYLLVRLIRWSARNSRGPQVQPTVATAIVALALITCQTAQAEPTHPTGQPDDPVFVRLVESAGPMTVPDDAIIVPYDPMLNAGIFPGTTPADQLLVPYRKYVELWNLTHPRDPLAFKRSSADYVLAGAAFSATLEGDRHLKLTGHLDIDVHTEEPLAVPLLLGGGVVIQAALDGAPARMGVARSDFVENGTQGDDATIAPLTLPLQGKGRHRLDLTVRLQVVRRGGWSIVAGRLPTAPATTLTLQVPGTGTEVRLSGAWDNRFHETTSPMETIETALDESGSIGIEWRPKVHEGYVDPSLTATSDALFDVREDGLRLIWQLNLDFGRTERDGFTAIVPGDYLVQTIDGPNVRGWVSNLLDSADDRLQNQELRVSLLRPARESGNVTIVLHRTALIGREATTPFDVPAVEAAGAVLHSGRLTIRRSPLLSVRTNQAVGVTRTDVSEDALNMARVVDNGQESPLGVQAYQAYQFTTTQFHIELTAASTTSRPSVDIQTVLRIGDRQRKLESRLSVSPQAHPVYQVRAAIPDDLVVDNVLAPTAFEWSIVSEDDRKILNVYLSTGRHDRFSIQIHGTLGEETAIESLSLPRVEVLDVLSQQGEIVVQSDPAIAVQTAELQDCREIALDRTYGWLSAEQRPLSRLAIRYTSPTYSGLVRISFREPIVTCSTLTNVRVTATAVEETVLLDFGIERAGIRRIEFFLPGWMKDARISLPLLRQKSVAPVSDAPDAAVHVSLLLQDDIMGRLRVLVENDRPLTTLLQRAPVPIVETGRVERQFVTLENAGRDEVLIDKLEHFETLSHQQKEWRTLTDLLGGSITQAYVANAQDPLLTFKTKERDVVETAGARIGLAETVLTADSSGAYRAALSYRMDNRTEQFLEVELPKDAQLWSAMVAGEPVKPARTTGASGSRRVRIPLTRTAAGDLDYVVLLKYGGYMPAPGGLRRVEFPLIATVNIPVELSQVRLFLPDTQRWSNFSGTMRRVLGEGDLAAGVVRYQTRLVERLIRTMLGDSPFAQVRAAANLEILKPQTAEYRQFASRYGFNRDLQQEIVSNDAIVRQAEVQSKELIDERQSGGVKDNRDKLNSVYANQEISRARNRVRGLPDNFRQTESSTDGQRQDEQYFDLGWLPANKLGQLEKAESSEDLEEEEIEPSFTADYDADARSQQRQAARQQSQTIFQSDSVERSDLRQGKKQRRVRRGETNEAVALYQQQLQKPRGPAEQADAEYDTVEASDHDIVGDIARWGIPVGAWPEEGAGLASLAVEFPARGVSFFFTTPRGEVTITARSVSHQFIETMRRIGLALAVIAIGTVGWVARLKWHAWFTPRAWSTLVIVCGFAGAIIGVLPILGLVMLVVGVGARIALRRRERAVALA